MDKIKNLLQELGYNESEASVYIALLQIGKSSVLEISKKAKVKRGSCYNILQTLVLKGLVNSRQDEKSIKYFVAHPKKILTSLENKLENTKEVLPEILKMYKEDDDSPVIQYDNSLEFYDYTGTLVRSALQEGEEVFVFANVGFFFKQAPDSSEPWFKMMKNKNYKVKVLLYAKKTDPDAMNYINRCKATGNPNIQLRIIENTKFPMETETAIFKDTINIFTGGKKYNTMVIQSKYLANTFKQIFTQIWEDGEII